MTQRLPHHQNRGEQPVGREENISAEMKEITLDTKYDAEAEYEKRLEARKAAAASQDGRPAAQRRTAAPPEKGTTAHRRPAPQRPRTASSGRTTAGTRPASKRPEEQRTTVRRSASPTGRVGTSGNGTKVKQVSPERQVQTGSAVSETAKTAGAKTAVRKSAAPKQRQKQEKKRVFSKGFTKGFLISWGIFVVLLAVVLILLSSFLKRYEAGLPEHYMNQIMEQIQAGDLSSLHLYTEDGIPVDDPSLVSDLNSIASFLKNKDAEEKLRYVKVNSESNETTNVFSIRSGDEKLLKVSLDRQEEGWAERETQMAANELKVSTITVQIPSACSLTVNGKNIDKSAVSQANSRIQMLANLEDQGFIGPQPTVDTYTVKGIFAQPEVVMTDASGKQENCTLVHETYVAGFEADEGFIAAQTERVMSMFEPYATYFSGDAGAGVLSNIMLDNSPAYNSATAADVSWMQAHDGITLSEQKVDNIKKYSDECYSCDIHFKQDIYQGGESVRTWDTNMTWIMVLNGDYYIADFVTKTATEDD